MKVSAFNFYCDENRNEFQFRISNESFEVNFFKTPTDYKIYVRFYGEPLFTELFSIKNLENGDYVSLCNFKKEIHNENIIYTFPLYSCFVKEYKNMIFRSKLTSEFSVSVRKELE